MTVAGSSSGPHAAPVPDERQVPEAPAGWLGSLSRDAPLVRRLLAGDEDAFRAVVVAWGPSLLRTAEYYLSSRSSAEEAVQETWTAVLSGLAGFQGRSSLKTWVFKVLINTAKTRAMKEARTMPLSDLDDERRGRAAGGTGFRGANGPAAEGWISVAAPAPWQAEPEPAALAVEARRAIADALLRLPHRQRVVVTLRDVHGYSSAEICDLLELTTTNQRVLLHRARAALRDDLDPYYSERRTIAPSAEPALAELPAASLI